MATTTRSTASSRSSCHQTDHAPTRPGRLCDRPRAGTRAGATAVGRLNRRDFGVDFSTILEAGVVVVGDQVDLQIEIEAKLNT